MSRDDGGLALLAGVMVGGLIGFAAGLLLAPKSGSELRSELGERGSDLREGLQKRAIDLQKRALELQQRALELQERVPEFIHEQRERVEEVVERGKATAAQRWEELRPGHSTGPEATPAEEA